MTATYGTPAGDDFVYRYKLTRVWPRPLQSAAAPGSVLWIMLNPSTATATHDDPTIRRCIRFSSDWGFDQLTVVNLFALRASNPAELHVATDPVGPENDDVLLLQTRRGAHALTIAAWGAGGSLEGRSEEVLRGPLAGVELHCLGHNKDGSPKHPLYVRADTELEVFRPGAPRRWPDIVDGAVEMFKETR